MFNKVLLFFTILLFHTYALGYDCKMAKADIYRIPQAFVEMIYNAQQMYTSCLLNYDKKSEEKFFKNLIKPSLQLQSKANHILKKDSKKMKVLTQCSSKLNSAKIRKIFRTRKEFFLQNLFHAYLVCTREGRLSLKYDKIPNRQKLEAIMQKNIKKHIN